MNVLNLSCSSTEHTINFCLITYIFFFSAQTNLAKTSLTSTRNFQQLLLRSKEGNHLKQRGPTAFDLLAILQKRDNSQATSSKLMYKTTHSQHLKLKWWDKWVCHWNYCTIANSNSLQISISGMPLVEASIDTIFILSIPVLVVQVGEYRLLFRLPFDFWF